MAKRKNIFSDRFDFQQVDPYGVTKTIENIAINDLHIRAILPDPRQPRQLLSADLYEQLFSQKKQPYTLLKEWIARADAPNSPISLKQAVSSLQQLASTIQQNGLINPITVREPTSKDATLPTGISHIIVTGERRWWSHVLLTGEKRAITGTTHPDRIRVTVVPSERIRALQLIENIAREDLSVIEKAQGLIALQEELSDAAGRKVTWQELVDVVGISRSYRSRILKVLKLSEEAQNYIAEHGLLEKTVRPVTANLVDRPDLQMQALHQIVAWQNTDEVTGGHAQIASYVQSLLQTKSPRSQKAKSHISPTGWVGNLQKRVQNTLKLFDELDDNTLLAASKNIVAEQKDTKIQLERLRRKIDELLENG
jgi:ParB/RepB/Spo0J family partition protein